MRGKAFIEYETAANAKKALAATNESTLDGRQIWVEYSGQSGSSAARTSGASNGDGGEPTTVFVGNVSFNTDENSLTNFFRGCGTVK